jgi:hypothetical protein
LRKERRGEEEQSRDECDAHEVLRSQLVRG